MAGKNTRQIIDHHTATEEKTSKLFTAGLAQQFHLLLGFDAFGGHRDAQGRRDIDSHLEYTPARFGNRAALEGIADFQPVEAELAQCSNARRTSVKVVTRKFDPQ